MLEKVDNELLKNAISRNALQRILLSSHNNTYGIKSLSEFLKSAKSLNELSDQQIIHLKLLYKWLNDEERFEKLYRKDSSLLERSLARNKKSSDRDKRHIAHHYQIQDLKIEGKQIQRITGD